MRWRGRMTRRTADAGPVVREPCERLPPGGVLPRPAARREPGPGPAVRAVSQGSVSAEVRFHRPRASPGQADQSTAAPARAPCAGRWRVPVPAASEVEQSAGRRPDPGPQSGPLRRPVSARTPCSPAIAADRLSGGGSGEPFGCRPAPFVSGSRPSGHTGLQGTLSRSPSPRRAGERDSYHRPRIRIMATRIRRHPARVASASSARYARRRSRRSPRMSASRQW